MSDNYFLKMIEHLRTKEEILLYGNILQTTKEEKTGVIRFLNQEYEKELLEYPYESPIFNADASLWAALTVYISAQLILYRETKEADLVNILPPYSLEITPAAILSADLCLRFLPDMITQLKLIDSEDALIGLLENILHTWHYSGISYAAQVSDLELTNLPSNPCLHQLYANRILYYKKESLATHPIFKDTVMANLGIFAKDFWDNLK